jgi:hypothetical protein
MHQQMPDFVQHMAALEVTAAGKAAVSISSTADGVLCSPKLHCCLLQAVLPTMSCSQLAKTGVSVRETYRAALQSTQTAAAADTATRDIDLLDFFTSQLPNQSWLLTYRTAVEKHLEQQGELQQGTAAAAAPANSSPQGAHENCSAEHLAEVLATIAALPIQVVQPLPIGFGTPRWSRPMAAADPAAWEHWLANLTAVYADRLAHQQQQSQQHHQQQQQPSEQLLQELADFTICLACSMRWVNINVDDDRLQTPEFRERVLTCLHQQQQQEDQTRQQHQQQQQLVGGGSGLVQPAQQQQCTVPFALAGSLAHRLTYTCLLLLLPPPRQLLSAFFAATDPADFSLDQLHSIVRGLLFVGCAPPEPWLQGLVVLVRGRLGEMGQKDMLSFVEAFRFFGTQVGRAPWLRDVTAMLEEFSCVA